MFTWFEMNLAFILSSACEQSERIYSGFIEILHIQHCHPQLLQ